MKVLENKHREWIQKCREAKHELAKHQAMFDGNNKFLRLPVAIYCDFLILLDLSKELNDVVVPVRIETKALVEKLEEENLVIDKQERTKEEKLKRTETQIRKALKNLRSTDISIYDVSFTLHLLNKCLAVDGQSS